MTTFLKDDNRYFPVKDSPVIQTLGSHAYTIGEDPRKGFYFQRIPSPAIPKVIYNNLDVKADRIFQRFKYNPQDSLGVLLSGTAGTGKSQLVALLHHIMKIPLLLVTESFYGEDFASALSLVDGPHILAFDEFDKVYSDQEDQQSLLGIFSGLQTSSRIIVVGLNRLEQVSSYFFNRPGRIHYHFKFVGLTDQDIQDYCQINLREDLVHFTQEILDISRPFDTFTFDMLRGLVSEVNFSGDSPRECLPILNLDPARSVSEETIIKAWLIDTESQEILTESWSSIDPENFYELLNGSCTSLSTHFSIDGESTWVYIYSQNLISVDWSKKELLFSYEKSGKPSRQIKIVIDKRAKLHL